MIANHDASQFVKPLRDDEQFHTIESTASDEEELCVIVANRTVQTGRIEFIIPPLSIKLACSFAIKENNLVKSLVIVIAVVSELIDICIVFLPIASITHWSSHYGIHSYNLTPAHLFLAS